MNESRELKSRASWKGRAWLALVAAVLGLTFLAWSSDTITLQGEWTLYTARCERGAWQGKHCTGQLIAAERHHFLVDGSSDVAFEVLGDRSSSGRLSQCTIE